MNKLTIISTFVATGFLSSCSLLESPETAKNAYERGFRDGASNEVKRNHYASGPGVLPPKEPVIGGEVQQVQIPEHVAPDGVIIEGHTELVEVKEVVQ